MPDWPDAARAALQRGATALVSVVATAGSSPREPGARMVVTADAMAGTIGGGALEYRAVALARQLLSAPPGHWRMRDYVLGQAAGRRCAGADGCRACAQSRTQVSRAGAGRNAVADLVGQCCGGRVRLLVERLDPARARWLDDAFPGCTIVTRLTAGHAEHEIADVAPMPHSALGEPPGEGAVLALRNGCARRPLYLFGAGHVGKAIVHALEGLPFALSWYDSRPELAGEPGVQHVADDRLGECLDAAPAEARVLILTHDHALDYRLVARALRGPASFVGLIGSASKRARFLSRLRRDGLDDRALSRLVCPIGLPGIVGKAPAIVAIAVVAQLLALQQAGCGATALPEQAPRRSAGGNGA